MTAIAVIAKAPTHELPVLRDVDDIADARAVATLAPSTRFARTLAALRLPEVVAA